MEHHRPTKLGVGMTPLDSIAAQHLRGITPDLTWEKVDLIVMTVYVNALGLVDLGLGASLAWRGMDSSLLHQSI
jgi:hypothetical protein